MKSLDATDRSRAEEERDSSASAHGVRWASRAGCVWQRETISFSRKAGFSMERGGGRGGVRTMKR